MNLKDYFKKAQKEGWAIGQFNVSNLETLRAVVLAAQNLKSPVIVGTSEGESKFLGLKQAAVLVRVFREETGLPIFLDLDHGKSLEYIRGAIEAGYDAVHFDGSQLPLEENIRITKEVVKLARKKGILTEGEVGVIGGELTRPEEAAKFVKETKVDNLAVNLGTLHGMPEKWEDFETIDLERLKEIKEAAGNIGLVLHGGSGVSAEEIKKAIKQGIVKINISSELRSAFTKTLKEVLAKNPGEMIPYKYMPAVIDGVQKIVEEKIKLFNFYADSNG